MTRLIKQVETDTHLSKTTKATERELIQDRFWSYLYLHKQRFEKHVFFSREKLEASSPSAECSVMTDRSACVTWKRKAKIAPLTARAVISLTSESNYLLGSSYAVVQKVLTSSYFASKHLMFVLSFKLLDQFYLLNLRMISGNRQLGILLIEPV